MRNRQTSIKAGSYVIGLILALALACTPKVHQWSEVEAEAYQVDKLDGNNEAQQIDALIEPYRKELNIKMNVVLGQLDEDLSKSQPESTLGNWTVDIVKLYLDKELGLQADMSAVNYYGLRINDIPAGDVTVGRLYELMPFDNYVVVMEMNYELLHTFLQHTISRGGWPISDGWELVVTNGELSEVKYQGTALDKTRKYKVIMNDYMANGGSDCSFLVGQPVQNTGLFYRDVLVGAAKLQQKMDGKLSSEVTGRVVYQ